MSSRARYDLLPGVCLDARRAIWFDAERALAVADLHLGYAWAHRSVGHLLPLTAGESGIDRLLALVAEYRPRQVFLLGDIVHRPAPVAALKADLRRLCDEFTNGVALRLISGNHDRGLAPLLHSCGIDIALHSRIELGAHLLLHGEGRDAAESAAELERARQRHGLIFMGHEHPAIRIGDGVAAVKCPCFLASPQLVILPAFSEWAAGTNVREGQFLSALGAGVRFRHAFAILAGKILPIRL